MKLEIGQRYIHRQDAECYFVPIGFDDRGFMKCARYATDPNMLAFRADENPWRWDAATGEERDGFSFLNIVYTGPINKYDKFSFAEVGVPKPLPKSELVEMMRKSVSS